MNIYRLIFNNIDVSTRGCFRRSNQNRTKDEKGKSDNGQVEYTIRRQTTVRVRESKNSCICIRQSEESSKSPRWKTWSRVKNFLILLSLFFTPFVVKNLTYFMLLDFACCGYDIQMLNNIGVV